MYCKQKKTLLYNDKYLEDYFESNVGGNTVLSSFVCDGIYEPIKPLYIAFKTCKQNKLKENFYRLLSTSPGRTTFFFKFNQEDQNLLEKLVGDTTLWNNKPIKSFKEYAKKYEESDDFNYFSELGIEKQELQFSNAMKLFLEHFYLTNRFLKHLGCKIEKSDSFSIEREKYNIDLFFTNFNVLKNDNMDNSKEKIVIIENKIKANVTPSDNDKTLKEQVEKVFRSVYQIECSKKLNKQETNEINTICKELGINLETKSIPSQLSKYYIYAFILAKKRNWSEEKIKNDINCFFLCPEYSKVLYEVSKNGYLENNTFIGKNEILFLQEKYKFKTYKDILPVFENCLKKEKNRDKYWYFLEDFVNNIQLQAKDRDDSLEQSMIKLFYFRSMK